MTALGEGDVLQPQELIVRNVANASLPASAKTGSIMYDSTNNKLVVWTGSAWETVTSS